MKKPSASVLVQSEGDLAHHFRELLTEDVDLQWSFGPGTGTHWKEQLQLAFDGRQFAFAPIYKLKTSLASFPAPAKEGELPALLVMPQLSSRVLETCKRSGIAAMDLNGRAWLRAPGLLVDRQPLPERSFIHEVQPRDIFSGKSGGIVRCLLTDRERVWTQAELVQRSRASGGLVSRVVHHLVSQGIVEKVSARTLKVADFSGLLDEWVGQDRPKRLGRPYRFAVFGASPLEIAERICRFFSRAKADAVELRSSPTLNEAIEAVQSSWFSSEVGPDIVLTQWIAAWLRHPYTEPQVTSAYVRYLPTHDQLEKLSLRPVTEGGNVWLYLQEEDEVYLETQYVRGLSLVTDAQIYLDLQRTGLRGPDAAAALREWEGFCRS